MKLFCKSSRSLFFAGFLLLTLLSGACSRQMLVEPAGLVEFERQWSVERIWSQRAGRGIGKDFLQLHPALADELVVVADHDGRISAYDRREGDRQWRVHTGDPVSAGLRVQDDRVLYGSRDGMAVALSLTDGALLWRVALGSELLAPPAADDLMAVFQTLDGRAIALDVDSGEMLWSYDTQAPVFVLRGTASPVISDGRVYTAFSNGKVVALDAGSGSLLWERRVAEPQGRSELDRLVDINNNLIVEGGGVFASSFQGRVMVLDSDSGQPFWGRDMSTYGIMASRDGWLYLADSKGHVWAISQLDGEDRWKQSALEGRGLTGVAVHQDQIVVGDQWGFLHWMDAQSGHLTARRLHRAGGFSATPVAGDDMLYILSRKGHLTAYRLKKPWRLPGWNNQ